MSVERKLIDKLINVKVLKCVKLLFKPFEYFYVTFLFIRFQTLWVNLKVKVWNFNF